jgi:hypothetical protein
MDQLPGDKAGQLRGEFVVVEADSPDLAYSADTGIPGAD